MTETFSVGVHVPDAEPGVDRDSDHAVSRALRVPMKEGKPQEALSPVWYAGPDDAKYRWLGALVLSAGDRVLFFPSWTVTADYLIERPDGPTHEGEVEVDHITLSEDRRSFHTTSAPTTDPAEKDSTPKASTLSLGRDRYFWFGLTIAEAKAFPAVKQHTIIQANLRERDVEDRERRRRVIEEATDPHDGPSVVMPEEGGDCPYVAPVVGPPGFELEADDVALSLPNQTDLVERVIKHPHYSAISVSEPVVLGDQLEIRFVSTWLPGPLDSELRISCGRPFMTLEDA